MLLLFSSMSLAYPLIHETLLSNEGWQLLDQDEAGFTVSQIKVPGYPLPAVKVAVDLELPSDILLQVIHDIENYGSFLRSASTIDFELLERQDTHVIAYQHINVPYFSNRHYLYRFDLLQQKEDNCLITGWELISIDALLQSFIDSKNDMYSDPVYIDEGTGRFVIEDLGSGKARLSYRLYMDIGGWIPKSLVHMANTQGIRNLLEDLVLEAQRRS